MEEGDYQAKDSSSDGSFEPDDEWDEEDEVDEDLDDEEEEEFLTRKSSVPDRKSGKKRKLPVSLRTEKVKKQKMDQGPPEKVPWEARYKELQLFRSRFEHCNVPKNWEESPGLSQFVKRMRYDKKIGNLAEDRIKKLDEIGFTWELRHTDTQDFLARLKKFKEQTGHLRISNNRISSWCAKMRQRHLRGELDKETFDALDALGFDWISPKEAVWESNIAKLKAYKEKHGNCNVPKSYPADPDFGLWCSKQRARAKYLTEQKKNTLVGLGFEFSTSVSEKVVPTWNSYFEMLKSFKKEHGNVDVTTEKNEKLHKWLARMKNQELQDLLAKDKRDKLTALGVKWFTHLSAPRLDDTPLTDIPVVPPQDWETIEIKEL